MRHRMFIAVVFASFALMMSVLGQPQEDAVRRITAAEAYEAVAQGKAILVDVRSLGSYNSGHIKGARWIELDDMAARARTLPRNKLIITYCAWPAEQTSARAVQIIKEKGLRNAAALLGGYYAWANAGFPTEKK